MYNPTPKLLWIVLMAIFVSCNSRSGKNNEQGADPLVSHIDSTVKPGDDFFLFANGKWFKQHPIPASEQSNGLWQLIQDTINSQVRNICESAAADKNNVTGSNKQKIGDFFFSGMDSLRLNREELKGVKADLDRIDGIKALKDIAEEAAFIHSVSGSPVFGFYIGQDDRISSKNAVFIAQGGLSLPTRDFYFDKDERAATIRVKFREHLSRMFQIMGYPAPEAKKVAENVMKLETAIAASSRKQADTRDPLKNYNKIALARLKQMTPEFDWTLFFANAGLSAVDTVIVGQPEFLTALNLHLRSFTLEVWKDYLKYHLIQGLPVTWMTRPTGNHSVFTPPSFAESR